MALGSTMTKVIRLLLLRAPDAVNSLTRFKRGLFVLSTNTTHRAISRILRTPTIRKRVHKAGHYTESHTSKPQYPTIYI